LRDWLNASGGAIDGVVAKRLDGVYEPGKRAMIKVKRLRTADCVVGGFRYLERERLVGPLLLGLYNERGELDHVGFTSAIAAEDRAGLTKLLEDLIDPPGFTGKAPGGPSRWATEKSSVWEPLRPVLVVEVQHDHITANRFRHGTKLIRWRRERAVREASCLPVGAEKPNT
jgi:ATP-dependent DNA ligase